MNSNIFGGLVPNDDAGPPKSEGKQPSQPNILQGLGMGNLVQTIID